MPTRDIHDIDAISQLNAEVHRKLKLPEQIANAFIEEVLASNGNISLQVKTLESLAIKIEQSINDVREEKTLMYRKSIITLPSDLSTDKFPLRPFHWPLEFPEVFLCEKNGFDGIVGNPPFLGGKRISTIMGATYNSYLAYMHLGTSKNTDLVAHFFGALLISSEKGELLDFLLLIPLLRVIPDKVGWNGYSRMVQTYMQLGQTNHG